MASDPCHDPDAPPPDSWASCSSVTRARKYGGFIVSRPEVDRGDRAADARHSLRGHRHRRCRYDGWADLPRTGCLAALNALPNGKFARHSRGYFDADGSRPNLQDHRENTTYVLLPAPPVIAGSQSEIDRLFAPGH